MGTPSTAPVATSGVMLWIVDGANTDELLDLLRQPAPCVVKYSADNNTFVVGVMEEQPGEVAA